MKRIAYELYDPCLTIKENADKLSCSVAGRDNRYYQWVTTNIPIQVEKMHKITISL